MGKPSQFVIRHPCQQLSLAIPPWVDAVGASVGRGIYRHTAQCTSPVSMVLQCKLVPGRGLKKQRSMLPYRSGRTLVSCCMSDGRGSKFSVCKLSGHGAAAEAPAAAAPAAAAARLSSFNASSAVSVHEPAWY